MNIQKMIVELKNQVTTIDEAVVALEKLAGVQTGVKKRGRPPVPKCEKGCGRKVHKGKCKIRELSL
jgi:hypothetical protein